MAMFDSVRGTFSIRNFDFRNENDDEDASATIDNRSSRQKRKTADKSFYFESDDEDEMLSKKVPKKSKSSKASTSMKAASFVEVKLEVENDEDPFEENVVKSTEIDESDDGDEPAADESKGSEVFRCELCTTTTQTKQSMRRHCLQSHDLVSRVWIRLDLKLWK